MSAPLPTAGAAHAFSAEDAHRAELWGLLARLYINPPDATLLHLLALQGGADNPSSPMSPLQSAWRALANASASTTQAQASDEFETLFGGIGRPAVYVYGSYYLAGALHEKPLARLRGDLLELGIKRRPDLGESEDHFAILAEIMRFLIAGEDPVVCVLPRQRELFRAHIQPWGSRMCEAIADYPAANFYAAVAELTREFLAVEQLGFDLLD